MVINIINKRHLEDIRKKEKCDKRHLWGIKTFMRNIPSQNLKLREIIYEEYGQKYDKEKTSKRC